MQSISFSVRDATPIVVTCPTFKQRTFAQMGRAQVPPNGVQSQTSGLRAAFTLLETVVVLMITVAALAYGAQIYSDYLNALTNRAVSSQLKDLSLAYSKYLQDNYAAVLATVPSGGYTTVPLTRLTPQYLSTAFTNLNAYGQSYVLAVRQPDRTKNALEAIVYSTGGEVIANKNALTIALETGSGGGYTLAAGDGITVQSTFGGYTLSLAQYGASGYGKLVSALFVTEIGSKQSDSYLSRSAVTGRPDLNQMRTNIDMSGNALINSSGVTATTGDITASNGTLRGNAVVAATSVTAGGLITAGAGIQSNGPVSVAGNIQSDGNIRGASITSTGVISAGSDIFASGAINGNTVNSASSVTAGSTITAAGTIVSSAGDIQSANGKVQGKTLVSDATVSLALGSAVKGGGCLSGTLGLDIAGKLYACVSSTWVSSSGYNSVVYGPLRVLPYSLSPQTQTDTIGSNFSLCSISYMQADQNSSSCQVYQSGNTWLMYTASGAGSSAGCQAVCLPQ